MAFDWNLIVFTCRSASYAQFLRTGMFYIPIIYYFAIIRSFLRCYYFFTLLFKEAIFHFCLFFESSSEIKIERLSLLFTFY